MAGSINCTVGDIMTYYREKRFSKTYKEVMDPNTVSFHVDLETPRSCTYNLLLTDGSVSESDSAEFEFNEHEQENVLSISKEVSISNATYLVHIVFVKTAGNYITETMTVYMNDLDDYNSICESIPHDIYFW